MTYKILQKNANNFYCENCDFISCNKYNYLKHLDTRKHKILTNTYKNLAKVAICNFECECGKQYKHRQSLNSHKKICPKIDKIEKIEKNSDISENEVENYDVDFKELVCKMITENNEIKNSLIKENQELRAQVNELIPKIGINNSVINSNNKFNVQIFLNEHCKHAINMKDFIDSIKISLQQLDIIKNKGLIEGLTNAILENISKLSLYERPIHCTDIKRETLYIKDNDIWEKDNSRENIKKAIKEISHKPYYTLKEWLISNPNYMDDESKQNYFIQTTRTLGKNSDTIDNKVIKKICSNTYIKDDKYP